MPLHRDLKCQHLTDAKREFDHLRNRITGKADHLKLMVEITQQRGRPALLSGVKCCLRFIEQILHTGQIEITRLDDTRRICDSGFR